MGKGGGGGKQHVPVEKADNLKSTQTLRIIDLISEGEIEGPVNGLQSVYFDDTPVQNSDGSYNFSGLDFDYVTGTPNQPVLTGFDAVENEVPVNAELKHGDPLVRSVTSQDVDAVRVTVGVKGLLRQKDNGDTVYNKVQLVVRVDGKAAKYITINGKTTSEYLESVTIPAPSKRPFSIRVERVTGDFSSSKKQGATFWSSYTEIIDSKLTYPNTALVGIALDSSQFSGVPRRNYLIRGRRIRVPSNYDPETRTYSGLWDGTFKIAWSNNPAWVFYDLATCERAGLGRRIGTTGADKWTLYQIGQYCDQLVDDGKGGEEPRLTCNVAITDAQQAGRVLDDLCSLFRAMPLWNGYEISASVDMPRDPVARYTNANVIDGHFKYSSTGLKARKTAVHVKYVSPNNGWKETTKYVSDDDAIARYGLHVEQLTAWGCISESQAIRAGRWFLATNQFETQTVNFKIAREGIQHLPGDVIEVMDNFYAGAQAGGRVVAVDGTHVTLDRAVTIRDGEHGHFGYLDSNASAQSLDVLTQLDDRTLALNGEPDIAPNGVWTLSTASLKPRLFRCVGLAERDGVYDVTALQHEPDKHSYIEDGIAIEQDSGTLYAGSIPPVEHLQLDLSRDASQYQVRLHWRTPRTIDGLQFDVELVRDGRIHTRKTVDDTELALSGLRIGHYTARVRAKTANGQKGAQTTTRFEISAPETPVAIDFDPTNFSITARPELENANALGTEYDWYFGDTRTQVEQRKHRLGRAFILTHQGRKPDTQYWYGVEAVNAVGRSELVIGSTKTLLKPEDILNLIGPEIPKIDWIKELRESVENNSSQLVMLSDRAALVVNKDNRISGISVSAESEASAIDFLADFVSFTNPDTLDRDLFWDSNAKTLVMKGEVRLLDGTRVAGASDLASSAGAVFRLETETGAFPSSDVATSLFESEFKMPPARDTVFTLYAMNEDGTVKRAESRMFDGQAWYTPKMFVDGNLIAIGTIRGDRITAGSVINAPVIDGGEIRGGSALFGEGGRYSGHHTRISSDGRIDTDRIHARGGTLDSIEVKRNCVIRGTLDGADGSFSGTVSAKKIVGAKILKGSGKKSHPGRDPATFTIDTGVRASPWGDSKRTFVVEVSTYGTVRSSYPSNCYWSAGVIRAYVKTRWSGGATICAEVRTLVNSGMFDPDFAVKWKLYEVL